MVATRKCITCGCTKSKSEYSKTQWSKKKKDGESFASKCKDCVDTNSNLYQHHNDDVVPSPHSVMGDDVSLLAEAGEQQGGSMRKCFGCGCMQSKSAYSNTQWLKKREGQVVSKCKLCVGSSSTAAIDENASVHHTTNNNKSGLPSNRYTIANQRAQKVYEEECERTCVGCGDTSIAKPKKRCTACKSVWYCGRECQVNHRHVHKKFCNFIKNGGTGEDFSLPYFCHDCQELFTTLSQLTYHKKHKINCNPNKNGEDECDDAVEEDFLNEILADINVIETLELQDPDDADGDFMKNLEWQRKHWNLCYCREEQLEDIRKMIVYSDWEENDYIAPRNVDDDNMECLLCHAVMVLDGEYHFDETRDQEIGYDGELFRANRFACCGARYCHKKQHQKHLATNCPSCTAPLITAEKATKESLLRYAKDGKTWAQLELAERYNKRHPSVVDDAEETGDYNDLVHHYENNAIEWARKASDLGNVLASIFLAKICHGGGIRTSEYSWSTFYDMSERTMLMKRAADTGDDKSIAKYAERANMMTTREETLKYWTLCAHQSNDVKDLGRAYNILAEDCENTGGLEEEERQLYLYEQGALNGNAAAMAGLVYILNNISTARYGSCSFTKYSQLPKMYYWAKKSAEAGCREGIDVLDQVMKHQIVTDKCACLDIGLCVNKNKKNKGRGAKGKKELIPCERCEAVFFCSNICREAYDEVVGHKEDCCSCTLCKVEGPYMGFPNWRRPCGSGGSVPMTWDD